MQKQERIYLEITQDEYQLPVNVYDSLEELAEKTGHKLGSMYAYMSKVKKGKIKNPRYICVEMMEEEDAEGVNGFL